MAAFFVACSMNYHVYIIWNPDHQRPYVGQTQDLLKRLAEHNDPEDFTSKHTKKYTGSWILIHSEEFETRSESMKREKELKTGVGRDFIKRLLIGKGFL